MRLCVCVCVCVCVCTCIVYAGVVVHVCILVNLAYFTAILVRCGP